MARTSCPASSIISLHAINGIRHISAVERHRPRHEMLTARVYILYIRFYIYMLYATNARDQNLSPRCLRLS